MRMHPDLHPPAANASPQPLEPLLVDLYRHGTTRSAAGDLPALLTRAEAAAELGRLAFADRSRAAWEVAQLVQWRLHHRAGSRPTEPGDVLVLDTLYQWEERNLPALEPTPGLSPLAFCAQLALDVADAARTETSPVERMCAATLEDWRYIGHNWLAEGRDFTRMIALASLPLPHRSARWMYHNLYDESGRGSWQDMHYHLLARFLRPLGVPVPGFDTDDRDDDALLYWTAPEVIAEINMHKRALWHEEPGWGLGALWVVEHLVPVDLVPIVASLRRLGVDEDRLAFFLTHIEVDGGHAEDWMSVVEEWVTTPAEQRIVHRAAIESARWFALGWEGLCNGWARWSETGVPPHLPARELRAACGL